MTIITFKKIKIKNLKIKFWAKAARIPLLSRLDRYNGDGEVLDG